MRALEIARAADEASTSSRWTSFSAKRPSPVRLFTTWIAPSGRPFTDIGADRMERVWKPDFWSTSPVKRGSLDTSSTAWVRFSPMVCPMIPLPESMRRPVMGFGPTDARQWSVRSSSSSSHSEPASAPTWATMRPSARSRVFAMSCEPANSSVMSARSVKAPSRRASSAELGVEGREADIGFARGCSRAGGQARVYTRGLV